MGQQVIEIVNELVELTMKTCCERFWLHDVDGESMKIARAICNADRRAKNECRALGGWHNTGELERCHRVRWCIFDAPPYLARQLSVFYRLPTEGYTRGGKF
jgi:hypothetical protein